MDNSQSYHFTDGIIPTRGIIGNLFSSYHTFATDKEVVN
jgi:hypothetical protein